ncbi:branched-chain amino acid transporter permease [Gulosibacter molinativorax]|uniref:Branched-chain amino acid ABC transporter n=1 Tax=Gulosibacter molinativorax TaxID=256821 RepID=A0ABT7C8Z2_9MICO|nr:AzlD domain-containing protein [Gulosibacter molinativorax]MDJ1371234.1 branched-chain amino acid ABC transporter [Gulosibacter molinativorax]QUY63050.1 Hypotetical protein [Gulosibacter molinativorax]
MNVWHSVLLLVVIWAITFALRAAPLVLRRWLSDNELVRDIGALLPVGVMVILTAYTVRDMSFAGTEWVAPVVGILVTVLLHLWRSNVLVSLVGGVASYSVVYFALAG